MLNLISMVNSNFITKLSENPIPHCSSRVSALSTYNYRTIHFAAVFPVTQYKSVYSRSFAYTLHYTCLAWLKALKQPNCL